MRTLETLNKHHSNISEQWLLVSLDVLVKYMYSITFHRRCCA